MVIYKGLQDRSDRQAVPLPFSNRGGILFNPSAVQIDCLYGIDGATYHLNYVQPNPPGCSKSFCSPNNNHGCGFNGAPATAWAPRDMQRLLELHKEHGAQWHNPGWHSGYNEVIVNSRHYNDHLPNSVWAFFYPKGQDPTTWDLGYGIQIDVRRAHRDFLAEYGLTARDVPLLEFDPSAWDRPFQDVTA